MMISIAIVEDDKDDRTRIEKVLLTYQREHNCIFRMKAFDNGLLLKQEMEQAYRANTYLLDIEMAQMDGIQTAKMIREKDPEALLILISRHPEKAYQIIDSEVFRFVEKREIEEKLPQALSSMLERFEWERQENCCYFRNSVSGLEIIYYRDILYLTRSGKYVLVKKQNEEIRVRGSLKQAMEQLDSDQFVFADKGRIINVNYVIKVDKQSVSLTNGETIEVSVHGAANMKEKMRQKWQGI